MTIQLREKTSLGKVAGKRKWYSRIIAVGAGSSGYYTEAALKDHGPAAFPAGTKINLDHQSLESTWSQPAGTLATLAGIVASTPEFKEDGLYAEVEFGETYGPFVEEFAEFIGLSINAQGWGEEFNDEGQRIIEGFVPSVLNTVDLVTEPGAKGRLLKALESYGSIDNKIVKSTDKENKPMDEKDVKAIVDALTEALTPALTAITEALTPAVEELDEEGAVDVSAVTEALITAGLPEVARKQVYEAVESGADPVKAIEGLKALGEAFTAAAAESAEVARVQESGTKESVIPKNWSI